MRYQVMYDGEKAVLVDTESQTIQSVTRLGGFPLESDAGVMAFWAGIQTYFLNDGCSEPDGEPTLTKWQLDQATKLRDLLNAGDDDARQIAEDQDFLDSYR